MRKFSAVLFFLGASLIINPAAAENESVAVSEVENLQKLVEYKTDEIYIPPLKTLKENEDDLYDGAEIKPLTGKISAAEKAQQNAGSFESDSQNKMPDLGCNDQELKKQIGSLIYDYVRQKGKKSVPEQRAQVLLARNINPFAEVTEKELNTDFSAAAALMHLKVNEKREIYKLCASKNNHYKHFNTVYAIIYPYLNYYKVVVTNLLSEPEKTDEAAFIYSW